MVPSVPKSRPASYHVALWIRVVSVLLLLGPFTSIADDTVRPVTSKPNVVLINVDDADYELFTEPMLVHYPNIERMAKSGVEFTNLHVTTPFCGPSRASLFRGQYAHRCGVRVNVPQSPLSLGFRGGYSEFLRQDHDRNELGVWMKNAGYRTMMIGKYHHNGFDFRKPPGWDDFYMSNGARYVQTYRFTTRDDPNGKKMAPETDRYRTDIEANDAETLIRRHNDRPFFLYVAPLAPHRPVGKDFSKMVDQSRYGDWNSGLEIPAAPDLNEEDIEDKPLSRRTPAYSDLEMKTFQYEHLCRARAMKSVDDLVGRILSVLNETGKADQTYIFFTSDNGYQLGHHRQHNKNDPYDRCTRVPLFVTGPNVAEGKRQNELWAHFDIAATIAEIANAQTADDLDARSFLNSLRADAAEDSGRKFVVLENWQSKSNQGAVIPGTYSGLRFQDSVYIAWATGEKEYYDLTSDQFQIENQFMQLAEETQARLHRELQASRAAEMDPLVTIAEYGAKTGIPGESALEGVAEDDFSIARVNLTIQNDGSKKYWNGTDWQHDPIWVEAELFAANQQLTFWRYPVEPLVSDLSNERSISIRAIATDNQGNQSEEFVRKNCLLKN